MGIKMTIEDYEITKEGQVINKRTQHILKPQSNNKGYLRVILCGKKYFVHRLVAEKYIPNPNNYEQVNHIDGDKTNNNVNNLEWVSNLMNRAHAVKMGLHLKGGDCPWSKLNWEKVNFIRNNSTYSTKELSNNFNVSEATIRDVINYRTWKTDEKIC